MPHEPRDARPSGWAAVCLTVVGAVAGPLVGLALVLHLPDEWPLVGMVLLPIPVCGGFFLGSFAGYWLGTMIDTGIDKK
jgi:hypothetical protein